MKKIIIGVFLLISALSFSAERVVKMENAYVDDKGIVYVIGEKTPFTGIVENYKVPPISEGDSVLEGKIPFKNGVIEGSSKLYYPSGKLASVATFKNGKVEGLQRDYYENGKIKREISHKNGVVDGIAKVYYPTGKLMSEESYKNDQLDGIVKRYDENGKLIEQETYQNGNKIK
ncbi:toxin-antitoxin system YwqK family antitoxin [Fusobacterium animalis]|uniref:toxin-antitoxin system YwqK family antitoxin n=1 Tax=Fusobacterium animalis TaxID=76859 RepID=UPI0030CBD468